MFLENVEMTLELRLYLMVMSVALSSLKRRCLVALLDSKLGFCIDLRLMSQNN